MITQSFSKSTKIKYIFPVLDQISNTEKILYLKKILKHMKKNKDFDCKCQILTCLPCAIYILLN